MVMGDFPKVERTFLVTWTMEYIAHTHEEAAEQAWGELQDPSSVATILYVETYGEQGRNYDMEEGKPVRLES